MVIEVFSDDYSGQTMMSPRISFSHDLLQSDIIPVEERVRTSSSSSAGSSVDFDFCVLRDSFDLESSSADELFSGGKILPTEIKRRPIRFVEEPPHRPPPPPPIPAAPVRLRPHLKTKNSCPIVGEMKTPESEQKHKSFWRFKRSWSLNSGAGGGNLCPSPLLPRSNSTGSAGGGNRLPSIIVNNQKQNFLRSNSSNSWQKQPQPYSARPPLKRNNSHGYYSNNTMKFNPVLNIHIPPANLFRLGSIFCIGKNKY